MNKIEHPQLKEFKKDINYDQSIKSIDPSKGVVVDWSNQLISEIGKNSHFKILHDSLKILGPNIVSHEWIFGADNPELEIEIFVSSNGPETAGAQLLGIASNTSMSKIPYQKGPVGLGHIAICDSNTAPRSLVWVFYNVCFRIQQYEKHTDLLATAKWLQEYAEKNIVQDVTLHLPRIEKIELSREKLLVGEELRIDIICAKNIDKNRLVLSPKTVNDNLTLIEEDAFTFTFEALKQGVGKVEVILADKLNLLSSHRTMEIAIK